MTTHTYGTFTKALAAGKLEPAYYFLGAENVLKDEATTALLDKVHDPGLRDFNPDIRPPQQLAPEAVETVETVQVRFRTVGDMTCTCPVESPAANAGDVVAETLTVTVSERGATRMDDRTSDSAMERRKKEGYF